MKILLKPTSCRGATGIDAVVIHQLRGTKDLSADASACGPQAIVEQ
jgi:hypothetical protein